MFTLFQKSEKLLGISNSPRRYDLPLNSSDGTGFLKLLVIMMTMLAMIALTASFVLSQITQRWSSGLSNKATIEIPAQDVNGQILSAQEMIAISANAEKELSRNPAITSIKIMEKEEIQALVSPWLGESASLSDIPLPGLITITFEKRNKPDFFKLETELKKISPVIRIDTHETWLNDILRFAGALQFAAVILTLIITATTVIAVAGAVKSRIAVHKEEVELLHLMGASDSYITSQFQRHLLFLGLKSGFLGMCIGAILLYFLGWMAGQMDIELLPDMSISFIQILLLACLPAFVGLLSMLTARATVHHALTSMA